MRNQSLTRVVKRAFKLGKKAVPGILLGTGLVATWFSGFSAGLAKPKADELIKKKKEEKHVDKLTPLETLQTVGPVYAPAAVAGAAGVAIASAGLAVEVSRVTEATAIAKNFEEQLNIQKEETAKVMTDDQKTAVEENVKKRKLDSAPKPSGEFMSNAPGGNDWIRGYETITHQWFWCRPSDIERAQNDFNQQLAEARDAGLSYNDWLYVLNGYVKPEHGELGSCKGFGDTHGYNIFSGMLKLDYSAQLDQDNIPVLVVDYAKIAFPNYDKLSY